MSCVIGTVFVKCVGNVVIFTVFSIASYVIFFITNVYHIFHHFVSTIAASADTLCPRFPAGKKVQSWHHTVCHQFRGAMFVYVYENALSSQAKSMNKMAVKSITAAVRVCSREVMGL